MYFRLLLLCILSCFTSAMTAQVDSIGEWRSLQSFRYGTYVTESTNSIIYTTGRAIFYLDKEDLSITTLTKEDGLTEARIRLVRYHLPTETLVIVYESGVIDLLRDGRFITLRQIDNFNFNGDKTIYSLFFGNDNLVYISAGFGLTVLDLVEETFQFTTFTGVRVNASAETTSFIYLATNEGVYRAPRTGVNLNDFGNWRLLGPGVGLPGDYSSSAMEVFRDQVYFSVGLDVYKLEGGRAALAYKAEEGEYYIRYMSSGPEHLLVGYRCDDDDDIPCFDRQLITIDENGGVDRIQNCLFRTNYALEETSGRIWFAEREDIGGIGYLNGVDDAECTDLEFGGPRSDDNNRLLHDGTALWVAPGVLDPKFSAPLSFGGFDRFFEGTWTNYREEALYLFGRDGVLGGDDEVTTIVDIYYDRINDRHWVSSYYEGSLALDFANQSGELFDETNSTLSEAIGEIESRIRSVGAVTDPQGFVYVANRGAKSREFVQVRSPEGDWAALGADCGENQALDIALDQSGFIWVIHADNPGGGITVIDHAGTPMDASDDRCRTFTSSNSNLPTNIVRSIAVDLDGVVWIGTAEGIVLFECLSDVFNTERCLGRRPVAEAEDGNAFLLGTEEILSITVDGGDRKWISTGGGAYLLSPNGEEQLLFFDAGNSPLLDDVVRDIAIDPNTGTVYFGTESGIISYRAVATQAGRTFREDLTIFPNPVEPGYAGPIAIDGLIRDARIKITDISGKLINEGTATGGQYIWDGADYNGRRVQSGVYLIFASSNVRFSGADPESAVGKIVFIK